MRCRRAQAKPRIMPMCSVAVSLNQLSATFFACDLDERVKL
jgi:hypothetical protein